MSLLATTGCGDAAPPAASSEPIVSVAAEPDGLPYAPSQIQFVRGYDEGLDEARRQSKPMLVFFTARWCTFCHQMCDESFSHAQVVNLAREFVCVLVDADTERNICREFGVRGYPTVQFVSPRGVPLNRVIGKKPPHELVIAMQAALQAVARRIERESELPRF